MYVQWRGGDLDRLLDEAHAGLVERVAQLLRRLGWQVLVEVSYTASANGAPSTCLLGTRAHGSRW